MSELDLRDVVQFLIKRDDFDAIVKSVRAAKQASEERAFAEFASKNSALLQHRAVVGQEYMRAHYSALLNDANKFNESESER